MFSSQQCHSIEKYHFETFETQIKRSTTTAFASSTADRNHCGPVEKLRRRRRTGIGHIRTPLGAYDTTVRGRLIDMDVLGNTPPRSGQIRPRRLTHIVKTQTDHHPASQRRPLCEVWDTTE